MEADSYLWHASLADWQRDRARNNELIALGWSILPLTAISSSTLPRRRRAKSGAPAKAGCP